MSDQYSTRRGLSVRTGPAADIALGAWNGAATNDPAQMISGAVHAAEKAVPAAIAAEGVNAAGRFLGQVPREIDRVRQGLDYERIQPWLRENARQLSAQELGFRTRPLTPIPPRATVGDALGSIGTSIKRQWPLYRQGLRFWAPQIAKGVGAAAAVGAAGAQALTGALEGAYTGLNTPTEEYQRRTGIESELGARALGVMGDIGNATTFGLAGKAGRKIADWIP